ncbi:MAG: RraA family protein [Oribacterium sp.]
MDRKQEAVIEALRGFSVPELCDGAVLYHTMDPQIRPWLRDSHIVGTAVTADVPAGEGGYVAEVIPLLKKGDVLVIAGRASCGSSYWGDHRSICARLLGVEGIVIDGAFRDLEGCREAGVPIFARAVTGGTALKTGIGACNVPVACGNAVVFPGDLICGDVNGICVLRSSEAEAVMERALDKRRRQKETIREMRESGKILAKVRSGS